MKIIRLPNEMCPYYQTPCIEDECAAFSRERVLSTYERRQLLAADNPTGCGHTVPSRWCSAFNKCIPIKLEGVEDDTR